MKAKEANILSFRIIFDKKGKLITEISGLPLKDVNKVFKGNDVKLIQTIIREGRRQVEPIHNKIEKELDAVNTIIT